MFIRADYKDDAPLIKHEQTHQQQMRNDGVLVFWAKYLFNRKCRQAYEVEAYKVQIAAGANIDLCAGYLASMYYLSITVDQAKDLLHNM